MQKLLHQIGQIFKITRLIVARQIRQFYLNPVPKKISHMKIQKLLDIKFDERLCFANRCFNCFDEYHQDCPDLEPFVNTRPNIAKVINDLVWPWSSKHFLLSLYLTNPNFNTFLIQDHLSARTLKKFSFFVICNALFQVKQIFLTHLY